MVRHGGQCSVRYESLKCGSESSGQEVEGRFEIVCCFGRELNIISGSMKAHACKEVQGWLLRHNDIVVDANESSPNSYCKDRSCGVMPGLSL